MGSRPTKEDLAYIGGFLDGDGSLMMQVKKRKDGKLGWRWMFTICFYQDTRHEKPLFWIRNKLGTGYISRRNDGITELRINGYKQVKEILEKLLPYIRFKTKQANEMLMANKLLIEKEKLTDADKIKLMNHLFTIQEHNYQSPKKKRKIDLQKILGLTP